MQNLKISLLQFDIIWNDKEANFKKIENLIENYYSDSDILILPEMFNTGFSMNPEDLAEAPNSISIEWMNKISKKHNTALIGSFMVKENGQYFNRLHFVNADSVETYDKRHLFRMGDEHLHFDGGQKSLIVDYKNWKLKLLICYDLRFPVWAKNNYKNNEFEYDALVFVANWPQARVHIWEALLRARAIENISYAVGVNRIGVDGKSIPHNGKSMVFDSRGDKILDLENKEYIDSIILNKDELKEFRDKFNVGLDWDSFKIDK